MLAILVLLTVAEPASSVEDYLLRQGVLGVVVAALGYFAASTIKRERASADAATARLQAQQDWVQAEVIPVLTRATDALARVADLLPESPRR